MAFLSKLGNVLEDAASFAVPAGLFALGTFAGGFNPLAGKALMGAAASGAGGFARNEEEERMRKAQKQAEENQARANMINALNPRASARARPVEMPKAGFMEKVARGGAQGYDFYKKAEMAAQAAKAMKNQLAKEAFEEAQRTGEMEAAANYGRGPELVDAITLTEILNKQRGGGGAKGVTQLGQYGPRGPVNPFASDPTRSPSFVPTRTSFKSVVEDQPPAGGMPGRFSAITGGGMRPEAAVGAQAMEPPPSAVDPFLQRPLSLTNIPTDTSLAGAQPSSIGLQTTPYERRVLQDVGNPFDRETQPTEYGSYEQETRRLQADADAAARAEEQIKLQRERLDHSKMAMEATRAHNELLAETQGQIRTDQFLDKHAERLDKTPVLIKYAENQANLTTTIEAINGMIESGERITGNQQGMMLRVIQRAVDNAQVTEKDLAITQALQGKWAALKLKFKDWTGTESPKIIGDDEIKDMVYFLEQTNKAVENAARKSIGAYAESLRLAEYSQPHLIDRVEKSGFARYQLTAETTPAVYTGAVAEGEFEGETLDNLKRARDLAIAKSQIHVGFSPELQAAGWRPGQAPMSEAERRQQQKYMGGQLKDFGTGFVNLLGQFARERPEIEGPLLGGRRSIGYADGTSRFLKSLGYGGGR